MEPYCRCLTLTDMITRGGSVSRPQKYIGQSLKFSLKNPVEAKQVRKREKERVFYRSCRRVDRQPGMRSALYYPQEVEGGERKRQRRKRERARDINHQKRNATSE